MLRTIYRQLLRTTAGYSFATLVGPLFTLVLTPIYTRVLGVADYGTVDTLIMLGTVFLLVGQLGMGSAIPSLFYAPENETRRPQVLSSALLIAAVWAGMLSICVVVFAVPITRLTLARVDLVHLTRLTGIGIFFAVVYQVQLVVLRLHVAIWRTNLLAIMYILVSVAANLAFVVWLRWGSAGVISASLTTTVTMGVLSLVLGRESMRAWPRLALMRRIIPLGALLMPAGLAAWVLTYEDRLFLVRAVSFDQIGIYAIAIKLSSMIGLLIDPFRAAWGPLALSIQQQPHAERAYARILHYFAIGGLGIALVLSLFAHEVLLVFTTAAYAGAAQYVWMLVLVPLAGGVQIIVSVGLLIKQRLGTLSWTILVAALVNTLLNIALIPSLGVWGAVVATVIACFVTPVLCARAAQQVYPVAFEWRRASVVLLVYLLLAGAGVLVGGELTLVSVALRAALLLLYGPLLLLLGVFDPGERALIRRAVRQPQAVLRWMTERA